jgi:transcription-repair coupling factor (superfamily II helicase)
MSRLKDKDLDDWYQRRFDLTAGQGWEDLTTQVNEMRTGYANVRSVKSAEELAFRQGQLDILDWIASMPHIYREAYDMMLVQEAEDADESI